MKPWKTHLNGRICGFATDSRRFLQVWLALTLCLGAFTWAAPGKASATEPAQAPQTTRIGFGDDIASAGEGVTMTDEEVAGNLFVAGQSVQITGGRVGTDVFAAGQDVRISGTEVPSALFAAGATVDLTTAGMPEVFAAGQQVSLKGTARAAHLSGDSVTLGGTVEGDVSIGANQVTIQPGTTVHGTLEVRSAEEPTIPSDATIGNYSFEQADQGTTDSVEAARSTQVSRFLISLLGMVVLAALMLALGTERPFAAAAKRFVTKPTMLLFGLLLVCVAPLAILILLFTVAGIRTALAALCLYLFAAVVSTVFCAISMGRLAFRKMNPWLSTLIMVVVFAIALKVPYLGPLVTLFSLLFTFGALFMAYRDWRGDKKIGMNEDIRVQAGMGAHSAGAMTNLPSD